MWDDRLDSLLYGKIFMKNVRVGTDGCLHVVNERPSDGYFYAQIHSSSQWNPSDQKAFEEWCEE